MGVLTQTAKQSRRYYENPHPRSMLQISFITLKLVSLKEELATMKLVLTLVLADVPDQRKKEL